MSDQQKLKLARDVVRVSSLPLPTLALGYIRYEKLRLLNARQYAELSATHLAGAISEFDRHLTFDDLVDGLEGPV